MKNRMQKCELSVVCDKLRVCGSENSEELDAEEANMTLQDATIDS